MNIHTYAITDNLSLLEVDPKGISDTWFTDDVVRWVDVSALEPSNVLKVLMPLRLPQAIAEAITSTSTSPRVIAFETLLFGSLPVRLPDGQPASLRFLCGPTGLLTVHATPIPGIDEVVADLQSDLRLRQGTVAALLFQILETVQRRMVPVVLALRNDLDLASEQLESGAEEVSESTLLALNQRAVAFCNTAEDLLFVLRELKAARSELLQLSTIRTELQDLLIALEGGRMSVLRLESRTGDLRQSYANQLQEATNRRLNVLAVLSAIYLPATLIAGIYGMNFENIPITRMPYGYLLVMLFMSTLIVGHVLFFWKRGWLK